MHPHRRRQLARLTFAPICQLRGRLPQLGKFTHHVPFGFGFRHFLAQLPGMVLPKFAFHFVTDHFKTSHSEVLDSYQVSWCKQGAFSISSYLLAPICFTSSNLFRRYHRGILTCGLKAFDSTEPLHRAKRFAHSGEIA